MPYLKEDMHKRYDFNVYDGIKRILQNKLALGLSSETGSTKTLEYFINYIIPKPIILIAK